MTLMRSLLPVLAVTLSFSLAACKKEEATSAPAKTADKSATPPPATPPAPPPAAPAAPAAQFGASMTCDALVSKDMMEKFIPGATVADAKVVPSGNGSSAGCAYTAGTDVTMVNVVCVKWDDATFKDFMAGGKQQLDKAKDVAGLGRAAFEGELAGMRSVWFWDDDMPCYGTVTGGKDPVGLAKAVVGTVNATTVK